MALSGPGVIVPGETPRSRALGRPFDVCPFDAAAAGRSKTSKTSKSIRKTHRMPRMISGLAADAPVWGNLREAVNLGFRGKHLWERCRYSLSHRTPLFLACNVTFNS